MPRNTIDAYGGRVCMRQNGVDRGATRTTYSFRLLHPDCGYMISVVVISYRPLAVCCLPILFCGKHKFETVYFELVIDLLIRQMHIRAMCAQTNNI